jgi:hypothetical protein
MDYSFSFRINQPSGCHAIASNMLGAVVSITNLVRAIEIANAPDASRPNLQPEFGLWCHAQR